MFESHVSAVKSQVWGNFSALNTSKAPGFIPIPCPTHSDYSITNICKSPNCIQPLCPQCIAAHVQLHQQTKKPAKIQNIINVRLNCLQKLNKIKIQLSEQHRACQQTFGGDIQGFLIKNRKKIQFTKSKLEKFIGQYFQALETKMNMIENAYVNQKQRKYKQIKAKLGPLSNHISQIIQYQRQLQSDDYIPALIELLNDPPKRPPAVNKPHFQDFGQVSIKEEVFQKIKSNIMDFITVNTLCPDQNSLSQAINRTNRFSNQMKFSRVGRQSSVQTFKNSQNSVSKHQADKDISSSRASRSGSRKKIFENMNSSIINSLPVSLQISKQAARLKIEYDQNQKEVELINKTYFKFDKGIVAYFIAGEKYFYCVKTDYAQTGFQRHELDKQIQIGYQHKCQTTPDSKIYIIGGQKKTNGIVLKNTYLIQINESNKYNATTHTLADMKQQRFKFGCCYFQNKIYVFGGRNSSKVLQTCQCYQISSNKWHSIRNMPEAAYSMQMCSFNNKIYKFSGILQNGQLSQKICIYYPQENQWSSIQSKFRVGINIGCVQINQSQILLFGGQFQNGTKSNESYLIEQKNNAIKWSRAPSLYNESIFQNSFVVKNSILALQTGEDKKHKIIMKLSNGKWRFLAC